MNGFEWGLDGWLYGANGDSGGKVKGISISGRDFRFLPDGSAFEADSGQSQYGRRRDDWSNWFGNNNPTWQWHVTLPEHYLRRNPQLAVKSVRHVLANYEDSTRVFPASAAMVRPNQPWSLNHVTSGCSPTPYRDDLFGPAFATSVSPRTVAVSACFAASRSATGNAETTGDTSMPSRRASRSVTQGAPTPGSEMCFCVTPSILHATLAGSATRETAESSA